MRASFLQFMGISAALTLVSTTQAFERNAGTQSLEILHEKTLWGIEAFHWVWLIGAPLLGWFAAEVLHWLLKKIANSTTYSWDNPLVDRLQGPIRLIAAVLFERGALLAIDLHASTETAIERVLSSLLVIGAAWAIDRALHVGATALAGSYEASLSDSGTARAARTRVLVLRRVLGVLVTLLAVALVLTQFELLRQVGVSLLASAGIASVVLGFAAQRSIATLLAGLQISIAQPVRIGDVVIIEGEWGTVEEITLTFVVVRIWDQRRLVLPIGQLLEKPFQNWTRTSPELMGTVILHADYTVPIEAVRAEVKRSCESDPDWDGRMATLIVLDADPTTVKLRALVSAGDADKLWDLRCRVRERLVQFLQSLDGGRYLPRTRFEPPPGRLEPGRVADPMTRNASAGAAASNA